MNTIERISLIVAVIIIAILAVCLWFKSNNISEYKAKYQLEQTQVINLSKKIDSLDREKSGLLSEAKRRYAESLKSREIANKSYLEAKTYREKYEALKDTTCESPVYETADSAMDNYEATIYEQKQALEHCDSANTSLIEAQNVSEAQNFTCKLINESKDNQLRIQSKMLKKEKGKTIALGTVGGFVLVGGLAGIIALSVLR